MVEGLEAEVCIIVPCVCVEGLFRSCSFMSGGGGRGGGGRGGRGGGGGMQSNFLPGDGDWQCPDPG